MSKFIEPKYSIEWIKKSIEDGYEHQYNLFWGADKSCLSQWWIADFTIDYQTYTCMEQYMMASKAKLFNDTETFYKIMNAKEPKQMKALGREVKNFDQSIWDKNKYQIVLKGNLCKFLQNDSLRDALLGTNHDILVEASPFDAVWGIKLSEKSIDAKNPYKWNGLNLLGFALMEVRDILNNIRFEIQTSDGIDNIIRTTNEWRYLKDKELWRSNFKAKSGQDTCNNCNNYLNCSKHDLKSGFYNYDGSANHNGARACKYYEKKED